MVKINQENIVEEILQYINAEDLGESVGQIKTSFVGFTGAIGDKKILSAAGYLESLLVELTSLVHQTVTIIEKISKEMNGFDESKKKVLVKFLDDQIELPFYLEWLDDNVIGDLIDEAVEYYNSYGWNEEVEKVN